MNNKENKRSKKEEKKEKFRYQKNTWKCRKKRTFV